MGIGFESIQCAKLRAILAACLVLVPSSIFAGNMDVVLNEVHYHPAGGEPASSLEFVELFNRGALDVDLSGWFFSEGLNWSFPAGSVLRAREFLVLSPEPARARSHYGLERVEGPYTGRLDNSGEILSLVDAEGQIVARVRYDDEDPWPSLADGRGPSLEFQGDREPIDRAGLWGPSLHLGGSPGAPNSRPAGGTFSARVLPLEGGLGEVLASGGASPGFVELYNPRSGPLDLSGTGLVLASLGAIGVVPTGSIIPSGGHLLLEDSVLGFPVSSTDDVLILLDSDMRSILDSLELPERDPAHSAGRWPDGGDDVYVFPDPTPGGPNSRDDSPPVVIDEIYYHPPYEAPSGDCEDRCSDRHQWIELASRVDEALDLSGWSLSKGVDFDFPAGTVLPARAHLVVAASPSAFREAHPEVGLVVGGWTGRLSHSADTINLRDSLGNRVDHVRYGDGQPLNDEAPVDDQDDRTFRGSPWPAGADGSGRTLELVHLDLENRTGLSWRVSLDPGGTPGAVNSTRDTAAVPVMDSLEHSPLVPRSTDPILISCRAWSTSGFASTRVEWIPDGGTAKTAILYDDGLAPDAEGFDGVYTALIPPQPDGSIVRFRIQLTDTDGHSTSLPPQPAVKPYSAFEGVYYLFEVDDAEEPSNGQPSYRIVMARRDLEELQDRAVTSDVLLPAAFVARGKAWQCVGLRFRGETSRREDHRSVRVEFPSESLFDGVDHLNLNGSNGSGLGTSNAREMLASDLFRRAGIATPQTYPINLRFQGEVTQHHDRRYVRKENVDEHFLAREFGGSDGGNLYRGLNPGGVGSANANLSYLGESPGPYRPLYEKRTRKEEDDYSDIIQLTRAFDTTQTSDDLFPAAVEAICDTEEWARFFALQALLSNNDGGIWNNNGEDYCLYRLPADSPRPDAGKFLLVPWDLNEAFNDTGEVLFRPELATIRRFLRHPRFAAKYYAHLLELRDGAYSRVETRPWLGFLSGMFGPENLAAALAPFEAFLRDRAAFVDDSVPNRLEAGALPVTTILRQVIDAGATWKFHRGSSAPSLDPMDWTRLEFSDVEWESGQAGLGYGDNDDATRILDMRGNYTVLYARKSFTLDDLSQLSELNLRVDYDDAIVAYVNGVEIVRSGMAPGSPGDPVTIDLLAEGTHEAGTPANFEIAISQGLLQLGTNVLAIAVLNDDVDSSDLSLHPTLAFSLDPDSSIGGGCGGPVLVTGAQVQLGGLFDPALGRSVRVAGVPGALTYATSGSGPWMARWSASVPVPAGESVLVLQVFPLEDAQGLPSFTREIPVRRISSGFTTVGTTIQGNVVWTADGGPYRITSPLDIPAGSSLFIEAGTAVLLGDGVSITVRGSIECEGTESRPVTFDAFTCTNPWGAIQLEAAGLEVARAFRHTVFQHAEGGNGVVLSSVNARLVLDECDFRHLDGAALSVRGGRLEASGVDFEDVRGGAYVEGADGGFTGGSFADMVGLRRPLEIVGNGSAPFAIDGVRFEACMDDACRARDTTLRVTGAWIHGAEERGLAAIGAGPLGPTVVTGSIVTACGRGIVGTSGTELALDHDTVTACGRGLDLAEATALSAGGSAVAHSMIIWRNEIDLSLGEKGSLDLSYSTSGDGIPWPGEGNISLEPLFSSTVAGDFSLSSASPCLRTGFEGSDMGAVSRNAPIFLRGDGNQSGQVDISDSVAALNFLFSGGAGADCVDSMDANDDGLLNISDAIFALRYLFQGGDPIPPPYPEVGEDPTPDELSCGG